MFHAHSAFILVLLASSTRAADYRTEVAAVLSRGGCNQGACHGNVNGKGGFKLSLRGQDPAFDRAAIRLDNLGRRVDPVLPDASLLLLKATAVVPHEGGRRFGPGSPEYQLLHDWIALGCPDSPKDSPRMTGITVSPTTAVLVEPVDRVTLQVSAKYSDGSTRDVTSLAVFDLGQGVIASVTPMGCVTRERFGEVHVVVRYLDAQVAVPIAFVPARNDYRWPTELTADNLVDHHVFAKLQRLRETPTSKADDATFLRRVNLDTLGVLPTAAEVNAFLRDSSVTKRATLIDRLLGRPEFADYWAMKWSDLLHNEEKTLDNKGIRVYHSWLRQQFADGVPLNEFARAVIAGRGSTYTAPASNFYRAIREPYARAETVAQVFLGTRLGCAKCHNHPFDRWTQDDYHSFAALFTRVKYRVVENKRPDENDQHNFVGEQVVWHDRKGELTHPRTGDVTPPRLLGVPADLGDADRLQALADWVAAPDNPFFARTQVNRVWYHLFGRGIVEPNDDFRLANPPVNPALLNALAKELAAHRFNLRHLVRLILNSKTYQAGWLSNDTNADDSANFARSLVQPLEAEQLLDALANVLEVPARFEGYPIGTRAGQLPDLSVGRGRRASDGSRFLKQFGKPDRLMNCECERTDDTTVIQAFQLMTGDLLQRMLQRPDNRLGRLIAAGTANEAIVEELYLASLSRPPTAVESASAAGFLAAGDRRARLEDFAWGLLNSKEFLLRR